MASIDGYRSDIRDYHDIEDKLNKIIEDLDSASQNAKRISYEVTNNYRIDGDSTSIADRADTLNSDIDELKERLRHKIIPAIHDAISHSWREIERLEEEEDEDD